MSDLFDEGVDEAQPGPERSTGRPRALLITGFVLAGLLIALLTFSSLWTEKLWFGSVGFGEVFTTTLGTRVLLWVVFGGFMSVAVAVNIWLAHRNRPFVAPLSMQRDALDRYRDALSPMRGWLVVAISLFLGAFAGSSASGEWRTYLLWRHRQSFGSTDPYFGRDIGFYVFSLNWWQYVLDFAMAVVLISLMASMLVHYLYGGIRLQSAHEKFSDAAQVQLSVLVGLFVLLKAVDYYLARFDLLSADGGLVTGMTYTRDHAVLPARNILMGIALICALLFFLNVWRRTWLLPSMGLGLLIVSAVIIGMIWPTLMQRLQVKPSEPAKEAAYIEKNIEATRMAFNLDDAVVQPYAGTPTLDDKQLAEAAVNSPGIRLVDPKLVQDIFEQKQQVRGYYSVAPVLDVDRYSIDGRERDLVLGVRELNQAGLDDSAKNWNNLHTVYTHGYGVIAAYGNQRKADDGPQVTGDEPAWAERDIPPEGQLTDLSSPDGYEGRIYFGENSPEYSVVGKANAADPSIELDLPGGRGDDSSTEQTNTYDGKAGVPVGGYTNRLLYAIRFGDPELVLSNQVNKNSKILYERDPRRMVEKVAPWLTIDEDPFPAVVDGRVLWVLDGFTATNRFPLAQLGSYEDMTRDSLAPDQLQFQLPTDQINYMRNAVKATVDAYDGTVKLYAWDESDPILKAWMSAYPGTVLPKSEIPADVLEHMRYPEDLFKVQRYMLASYHVTDPSDFYQRNDKWVVATDPNSEGDFQPPYRLSVQTPSGGEDPIFSLTSVYTPVNRANLAAFVSVDSDASLPSSSVAGSPT